MNATDLFALSAISGGSRSVGRIYGFDEWIVSKYLAVGYGLSYMWQDYVATDGLVSPRVSMTVSPVNGLRLRAVAARNSFAPGSEEFVNAMDSAPDGMWLPAQRSFSPWSERDGLHAQTTDHVEFGVERDVAAYVVGVRTFYQSVNDQAGAIFAAPSREHPAASLGHYYLASLGDFDARGWGVNVSRPLFGARARIGRLLGRRPPSGAAGPAGPVPPGSAAPTAPSRRACTTSPRRSRRPSPRRRPTSTCSTS